MLEAAMAGLGDMNLFREMKRVRGKKGAKDALPISVEGVEK